MKVGLKHEIPSKNASQKLIFLFNFFCFPYIHLWVFNWVVVLHDWRLPMHASFQCTRSQHSSFTYIYQVEETDEARKKFSNAKSISSAQFFGVNKANDMEASASLQKFSVCAVILNMSYSSVFIVFWVNWVVISLNFMGLSFLASWSLLTFIW